MIKTVPKSEYDKYRFLFSKIEEYDLSITSLFEGNYFGQVMVDSLDKPSSGFIQLGSRTIVLAGDETTIEFNQSVKTEVYEDIIPTKMKDYVNKFFYIVHDSNWLAVVPIIFPNSVIDSRKYYLFDEMKHTDWLEKLPEMYSIHKIDEEFLNSEVSMNPRLLEGWIRELYGTQEKFLQRGFGFCLVYQDKEIASYNFINYINEGRDRVEMGIVTETQFQRKGFSKLLVSATLEHCLQEGITKIGWHTNEKNIASQKIAESVGFVLDRDYNIFLGQWV
ncbi:MAG: GNAT family N-acetyltransferase [Candidatus Heimdallarchaeaceae archaeon]